MSPTRFLLAAAAVAALSATPFAASAQTPAPAAAPAAGGAAKPVVANGDTLSTLKMDGQFTTFVQAVDATNLAAVIKTPNLTVFAPTDAAFAAMPAADLQKLKADKAAMQRFVLHHVINAPVPATKIKGTKGPWPTGAQDQVLLDGSDEAALKADGATIVQGDVKTATGTLYIVDRVLVAGQGAAEPAAAAPPAADAAATTPTN